ncbi:MAG: hypothetical protein EAX95_14135 [Candidatus Thorarchaeota archaeon]|nr:hypothetical protein [Candidatus Thorarchaeota archaeon]
MFPSKWRETQLSAQDFVPLLLMLQANRPEFWIALFFVSGLIFGIGAAIVVGFLWSRARKRVIAEAEAAGVTLEIETSTDIDAYGIEACGYCIGFIVIAAAGVLGISLPTLIPEGAEDLIVIVIITIFGAALWGLVVWSVPYYRGEKRRFQNLLDEALAGSDRATE